MPFNTQDDFVNALSNGRTFRFDWNKNFLPTTAAVANEWHCLARGGGNPAADTVYNAGTNLLFQPSNFSTVGAGGIPHGPDVGSSTGTSKHLINSSAYTAAVTVAPANMLLVDIIGFYRVTSVTTITAQTLTNTLANTNVFTSDFTTDVLTHTFYGLLTGTRVQLTTSGTLPVGLSTATNYFVVRLTDTTCKLATSFANATASTPVTIDFTTNGTGTHNIVTVLPRYTNGAGVQAMMWNTNATALGAATPNLSIGYTNSSQVASRATPTTLPIGKTACPNGQILYSGTGSGKYGPAMPLQSADSGIAEINTVTLSSSYVSGEFSIALYKPLMLFPITTLGVAVEKEHVNSSPSIPRIYDGANLHLLINSGTSTPVNSSIFGHIEVGWN